MRNGAFGALAVAQILSKRRWEESSLDGCLCVQTKCNPAATAISKTAYYVGTTERALNEDALLCVIKRGILKPDTLRVLYLADRPDKSTEERLVPVTTIGSCWLVAS